MTPAELMAAYASALDRAELARYIDDWKRSDAERRRALDDAERHRAALLALLPPVEPI